MRKYIKIEGIDTVMKNVERALSDMTLMGEKGLMQISTLIKKSMDTTPPVIPIEKGNLNKSWFAVTTNQSKEGSGGFTGKYAGELSSMHNAEVNIAKAYTKAKGTKGASLVMGFSAFYAIYVHESREGIKWTRPGSGPKFFQAALERNEKAMINILQKNIQQSMKKQSII